MTFSSRTLCLLLFSRSNSLLSDSIDACDLWYGLFHLDITLTGTLLITHTTMLAVNLQ
jgi:hypothetical protein